MNHKVIICPTTEDGAGVVSVQCADLAEAFVVIATMSRMVRSLAKDEFPSAIPLFRNQTLLSLAQWLTDGTFSAASREVFTQLCVPSLRSKTTNDVRRIAAFQVADELTAVGADSGRWNGFDVALEALKKFMTGSMTVC